MSNVQHRETTEDVYALIEHLASPDATQSKSARQALVEIGASSVVPLSHAMTDTRTRVRWEAAKALGQIGDPSAAPALIRALETETFSIRWLAAEGLIAMGREGAKRLLRELESRPGSAGLREGAHHVLRILAEGELEPVLAPVLQALEGVAPAADVGPAAYDALGKL